MLSAPDLKIVCRKFCPSCKCASRSWRAKDLRHSDCGYLRPNATQIQTDGPRPDSPVRILYAQQASLVSNAVRADGSRNPAIRDDSSSSTMRRRPGFANAREFCAGRSGDPRASWVTYITAWEPRARACRPTDAKGGNPSPQDQRDVRGNRALLRQAFGQVGDASLRRSSKGKR
jgi:hypothetical protein